jgi:hypothetical protein
MNALEIILTVLILIALTINALAIRKLGEIEKTIRKKLEKIIEEIIVS